MTDSRIASASREEALRGGAAQPDPDRDKQGGIGFSRWGPEARPPSRHDVEVRGSHLSKTAKGGPARPISTRRKCGPDSCLV